jgi:glutathione S-transferase
MRAADEYDRALARRDARRVPARHPPQRSQGLIAMLEVLGRASSINVRKVLWTCAELGLQVRHVPWGDGALSLASAEFRALNPLGLVPVLRDPASGWLLRESNTICRYLAAREARRDLLPDEPAARAEVEQWMDWMATDLNNAWRPAFMGLVRKHPAWQDTAAIERSAAEWNRQMGFVEAALGAASGHLTRHGFTLADIVVGLATHRWVMTPIAHAQLPAARAWYERLAASPAFAEHVAAGGP